MILICITGCWLLMLKSLYDLYQIDFSLNSESGFELPFYLFSRRKGKKGKQYLKKKRCCRARHVFFFSFSIYVECYNLPKKNTYFGSAQVMMPEE